MPAQDLSAGAPPPRLSGWRDLGVRRFIIFAATLTLTGLAFLAPFDLFAGEGFTAIELAGLALFFPLFVGISLWFANAAAGFVLLALNHTRDLSLPEAAAPSGRTALLAVIRNEHAGAVLARLSAIDSDLAAAGASDAFDIFILSDTSDPSIAAHEHLLYRLNQTRFASAVYYRRRSLNVGRKAGNVADWVRRFGGAYDFMVVLDADSLMSGDALVRLSSAMAQRPDVGLIQTIPSSIGAESLFARHLQFGTRLYGRVAAAGLAWWTGPESLYWGHNAMVRVHAFAAQAGLPRLAGAPPFGGEILSHDVVEGWLMRRAGWAVCMAPEVSGSYEETPPTLMEYAARDSRWCQGNLQHLALFNARSLHWLSRLQLLLAALVYAAAPLWLAFLGVGVALRLEQGLPDAGEPWFSGGAERILTLHWSILLTAVILFGPKLLGAALILARPRERAAFGGGWRLLFGLAAEMVMSALLAPVLMLSSCRAIFDTLTGRDGGWRAQRRRAHGAPWSQAFASYGWQSACGIALLVIAAPYSDLVIWMAPILLGLVFAAPAAALSATPELGTLARRLGLFVTPEELAPPPIVRAASEAAPVAAAPAEAPVPTYAQA